MTSQINQAVQAFAEGKLVAVPTETVYGLAAPIDQASLLEKIYALKKRPLSMPLSIQVSSMAMAQKYCKAFSPLVQACIENFWPGPLTLVVPANENINGVITAGSDFIGLRMPQQELTISLINKLKIPIAVPSANPTGKPPARTPAEVRAYFSERDVFILDGGISEIGQASTVVKLQDNQYEILRQGSIKEKEISNLIENF